MSLSSKIVAGIATTGAVGGMLSLGAFSLFNTQNIEGRLKAEGYEALNIEKDDEWNDILAKYKVAKTNTFVTGEELAKETTATLRNRCKEALEKKFDTEKSYLLARQWCVKERKVEEVLNSLKLRLLNTEDATGNKLQDAENWASIVTKHENSQATNKIKVDLKDGAEQKSKAMRDACKALNAPQLKTTTDEFNEKLEQIKEWCSVTKE